MAVAKIIEEADKSILATDMKPGQIGIITKWSVHNYIGWLLVCHRNGITPVEIGANSNGWDNVSMKGLPNDCRVRLIENGDKLEIQF